MYIYIYFKCRSLFRLVLFYFILFYLRDSDYFYNLCGLISSSTCSLCRLIVNFILHFFILLYGGFLFYTCRRPDSLSTRYFCRLQFQFILILSYFALFYLIVCFSFFLNLGGLTPSSTRSLCRLPRLFMMAGRQRVAAYCSVLNCVAVCRSLLQSVAVCCSVLQCVAVFCPFMMAGES